MPPVPPPSDAPSTARWLWLPVAAALFMVAAFGIGGWPLGIPGEWEWSWAPFPADTIFNAIFLIVAGGLFLALQWAGGVRIADARPLETSLWLLAQAAAVFGWLWIVQESAVTEWRMNKAAWVLFYPGASGYFSLARDNAEPLGPFLADYERRMSEGEVLHIGTHPPGLVVGYRWLMAICERSPWLTNFALATEPVSTRESFAIIRDLTANTPHPLTRQQEAVLWLASLMMQAGAAATVLPLHGLIRRSYGAVAAWWGASLWAGVPALALFLPKSDALFPCLGLLAILLWLRGWAERSAWRSVSAGFVTYCGMGLSLALLPAVFLAGCLTLWEGWLARREEHVSRPGTALARGFAWATVGFALPLLLVWAGTGMNLLVVWSWNLRNHAGFYAEYPRTYWKWLLVNPIELIIALGLPVAVAAVVAIWQARRAPWTRASGVCWCCLFAWACLWLSGKNMGEAARLWLILMPWFLWMAAGMLREDAARRGMILWVCQAVVQAVIVMRIAGFHLPV